MHTIDFSNVEDKYNPFNTKNIYASTIVVLDATIYDSIIDYAIHKDLNISRLLEIEKGNNISSLMLNFIKTTMLEQKIDFMKSSKYFLQTNFMKIQLNTPHSTIVLFFQLLGVLRKNKVILTNISFLKDAVIYNA